MDTKQIRKPLRQFVKKIPKSIMVDQVIVFGSYLDDSATQDSDIDILVISDDFEKFNEDQRFDVLYAARPLTEPIIHPWGFTNEELQKASKLTTLGHARDHGYRFI